jgi:hypothetical protein
MTTNSPWSHFRVLVNNASSKRGLRFRIELNKFLREFPNEGENCQKESKNENIQDCNFACGFVWVPNLVSDTKEHSLRVFENKVLRRIFGAKRDEVKGGWRKLHNEELRDLYSSPSIIRIIKTRRVKWAGHVARMGEKRNAYRLLVGKPEGKRPLGRPRRRWVDNIKMDLLEIGFGGVDWIVLAQDRDKWRALVKAVMNLRVP